jgi:Protein of unknown function (DUF1573)
MKFQPMKFVTTILVLTLGLSGAARAQLKWQTRKLDFNLGPSDTRVVAVFPFTNTGKKPIKFKEIKPSCGCTSATQDKDVYAPGESGKITAIFEIDGRTGIQQKEIYVASNDPKEPELLLSFKAVIPEILQIDNIFLNWKHGEELKPKTVNIKVMNGYQVHSLDVTSTKPEMATEVKHEEGSPDFQIVITPKNIKGELSAGLEVKPDFPKDSPKYFHIYLRVDG